MPYCHSLATMNEYGRNLSVKKGRGKKRGRLKLFFYENSLWDFTVIGL